MAPELIIRPSALARRSPASLDITAPYRKQPLDPFLGGKLGRYVLEERIQQEAGTSSLYLAQDTGHSSNRRVVVKLAFNEHTDPARANMLLTREGAALEQIAHTNVINMLHHGMFRGPDSMIYDYLVLEHLPGQTLTEAFRHRAPVDWREIRPYFIDLCNALEAAHKLGIAHGDIKPQNIILSDLPTLDKRPLLVLLDFGCARFPNTSLDDMLLPRSLVLGTFPFLLMDVLMGGPYSYSADLHSFGVLIHLFVTGKLPFQGNGIAELARSQSLGLGALPESFSADVREIIIRLISAERQDKFHDVAELRDAIVRAA
ncbi:serine/threonine protein kinase [Candidatus Micrarchaeota archaeon]|nr:serine/threonine protein kinase [Candidatus Micrarchaeota archaeon]